MKIERKRWVIMQNNLTLASFKNSWWKTDFEVEAVEITEVYETSD